MKVKNQFNYSSPKGEKFVEGDIKTVPGQSYEMREIVTTFIRTGRVLGSKQIVEYDEDGAFDPDSDCDVFDRPDKDLTDIESAARELTSFKSQREAIKQYALDYSLGKMSYDDFVYHANKQNKEIAAPYIKHFGELMRKKTDGKKEE